MRIFLLFIFIFINIQAFEIAPSWYPSKDKNLIIQYGDGDTLKDAKLNALNNIKKSRIESNISIDDIEILKEERLENHFFIKVKYNNLPLLEQVKNGLKFFTFKTDDENSSYMLKTNFLKDLNKSFGYFPDLNIKSNYLYLKDKKFLIKENEFPLFWIRNNSSKISIELNKDLQNNKRYFIKVIPFKEGFTTLVQVTLQNDVELLFSNKILKKNQATIFPNFKLSDGLEITIPKNKEEIKLMTMAIICDTQKDFSKFNNMFLSIEGEKFMMGDLINKIDNCEFSSIISTVKNKK